MSSLSTTVYANESDADRPHPLVRSLEGEKLSSRRAFQEGEKLSRWEQKMRARDFNVKYSGLKTLRDCGTIFVKAKNKYSRCESYLCELCQPQRANVESLDLRKRAEGFPTLIAFTTAISSSASTPLIEVWDALDHITAEFHGDRWMSNRVDAYRWHTEIAQGIGWHPHRPYLLGLDHSVTQSEIMILKDELQSRFADLANKAGFYAQPDLQHFAPITRTRDKAISYVTKGPLGMRNGSRTAGNIFEDAAYWGDEVAAADWFEIEEASVDRTWKATAGGFRIKKPKKGTATTETVSWDDVTDDDVEPPWLDAPDKHEGPLTRRQEWQWQSRYDHEVEEKRRALTRAQDEAREVERLARESTFRWSHWPRRPWHTEPYESIWGGPDPRTILTEPTTAPSPTNHEMTGDLDYSDLLEGI